MYANTEVQTNNKHRVANFQFVHSGTFMVCTDREQRVCNRVWALVRGSGEARLEPKTI